MDCLYFGWLSYTYVIVVMKAKKNCVENRQIVKQGQTSKGMGPIEER